MKRCKICRGMTYGKYIQAFGHNLERSGEQPVKPPKICAVCGAPLSSTRRKYCSRRCTRAGWWRMRKEKQA